jgi:hypothetical protein
MLTQTLDEAYGILLCVATAVEHQESASGWSYEVLSMLLLSRRCRDATCAAARTAATPQVIAPHSMS